MPERALRLRSGFRLWGSGTVLSARDGRLVDVDVRDLVLGDWVGLSYAREPLTTERRPLDVDVSAAYGSQRLIRLPEQIDESLALLLGMFVAEGHISRSNWTVGITNSVPSVLDQCAALWRACFGANPRIVRQANRCPAVVVSSKMVVEVLDGLGCGHRASCKRIPRAVLDSPEPVLVAFLRGLWLDAYTTVSGSMSKWALCVDSPALLDDLQMALRGLGIFTGRVRKWNPHYDKHFYEVYATGIHARRIGELVPFLEPEKAAAASVLASRLPDGRRNGADIIPIVHGRVLYDEIPKGTSGRSGRGTGVAVQWRSLKDARTQWPSRVMVQRLIDAGYRMPADVVRAIDESIYFSPVTAIDTTDP